MANLIKNLKKKRSFLVACILLPILLLAYINTGFFVKWHALPYITNKYGIALKAEDIDFSIFSGIQIRQLRVADNLIFIDQIIIKYDLNELLLEKKIQEILVNGVIVKGRDDDFTRLLTRIEEKMDEDKDKEEKDKEKKESQFLVKVIQLNLDTFDYDYHGKQLRLENLLLKLTNLGTDQKVKIEFKTSAETSLDSLKLTLEEISAEAELAFDHKMIPKNIVMSGKVFFADNDLYELDIDRSSIDIKLAAFKDSGKLRFQDSVFTLYNDLHKKMATFSINDSVITKDSFRLNYNIDILPKFIDSIAAYIPRDIILKIEKLSYEGVLRGPFDLSEFYTEASVNGAVDCDHINYGLPEMKIKGNYKGGINLKQKILYLNDFTMHGHVGKNKVMFFNLNNPININLDQMKAEPSHFDIKLRLPFYHIQHLVPESVQEHGPKWEQAELDLELQITEDIKHVSLGVDMKIMSLSLEKSYPEIDPINSQMKFKVNISAIDFSQNQLSASIHTNTEVKLSIGRKSLAKLNLSFDHNLQTPGINGDLEWEYTHPKELDDFLQLFGVDQFKGSASGKSKWSFTRDLDKAKVNFNIDLDIRDLKYQKYWINHPMKIRKVGDLKWLQPSLDGRLSIQVAPLGMDSIDLQLETKQKITDQHIKGKSKFEVLKTINLEELLDLVSELQDQQLLRAEELIESGDFVEQETKQSQFIEQDIEFETTNIVYRSVALRSIRGEASYNPKFVNFKANTHTKLDGQLSVKGIMNLEENSIETMGEMRDIQIKPLLRLVLKDEDKFPLDIVGEVSKGRFNAIVEDIYAENILDEISANASFNSKEIKIERFRGNYRNTIPQILKIFELSTKDLHFNKSELDMGFENQIVDLRAFSLGRKNGYGVSMRGRFNTHAIGQLKMNTKFSRGFAKHLPRNFIVNELDNDVYAFPEVRWNGNLKNTATITDGLIRYLVRPKDQAIARLIFGSVTAMKGGIRSSSSSDLMKQGIEGLIEEKESDSDRRKKRKGAIKGLIQGLFKK
ncbi:MAG: hypothetical protein MK193_10010 [Lentisphaeria bacterium]|nr:hypothetical protein [Lentisphaeria bacterium]